MSDRSQANNYLLECNLNPQRQLNKLCYEVFSFK